MFTKFCAAVSKLSLVLAVVGLIAVILCVQWQVIGRYVLNDTPTWAENLALLLVVLLPDVWQRRIELLIHALVGLFGVLMVQGGWLWANAKWGEKKPMLPVPDGIDYVPVIIAGALIVLFSIEHIVALLRGEEVEPAWN